ncbi:prealbumin-like fold domain-containing protein [Latilactobacillus sakei]
MGQYTVQEIKAPTGYEINPAVTKVAITDRKTATVAIKAEQQAPDVKLGSFVLIDRDQKTQLAIAWCNLSIGNVSWSGGSARNCSGCNWSSRS